MSGADQRKQTCASSRGERRASGGAGERDEGAYVLTVADLAGGAADGDDDGLERVAGLRGGGASLSSLLRRAFLGAGRREPEPARLGLRLGLGRAAQRNRRGRPAQGRRRPGSSRPARGGRPCGVPDRQARAL